MKPDTPKPTSELTKAVCAVMKAVPYVQKGGYNSFHKFKFASEADLLEALQPAMARYGLSLAPIRIERSTHPFKTRSNKDQVLTTLLVTYCLTHKSGESMEIMGIGEGADGEDKGAYKAMTGSLKYVLRSLFLVPTGDDPDKGPTKEERRLEHDPEFKVGGNRALGAQLGELGYRMADVAAWTKAKEWGRPSEWTREKRDGLVEALKTNKNGLAKDLKEFIETVINKPPQGGGSYE